MKGMGDDGKGELVDRFSTYEVAILSLYLSSWSCSGISWLSCWSRRSPLPGGGGGGSHHSGARIQVCTFQIYAVSFRWSTTISSTCQPVRKLLWKRIKYPYWPPLKSPLKSESWKERNTLYSVFLSFQHSLFSRDFNTVHTYILQILYITMSFQRGQNTYGKMLI